MIEKKQPGGAAHLRGNTDCNHCILGKHSDIY